jgi:hypothetical protein
MERKITTNICCRSQPFPTKFLLFNEYDFRWLLHDDIDYNARDPNLATFYGFGVNKCLGLGPQMLAKASSLRSVGNPADFRYSTLKFYALPNFSGREVEVSLQQSAILTGCAAFTLYE